MGPLARSLILLRDRGWQAQSVEHWNPHARRRQDLFGFIDVLAVKDEITLAVQPTSDANVSARVKKINESPLLEAVLRAGWRVEVWGWSKRRELGGQRLLWAVRRVPIRPEESNAEDQKRRQAEGNSAGFACGDSTSSCGIRQLPD